MSRASLVLKAIDEGSQTEADASAALKMVNKHVAGLKGISMRTRALVTNLLFSLVAVSTEISDNKKVPEMAAEMEAQEKALQPVVQRATREIHSLF